MENSSLFSTALEQTAYLLILGKMLLALVLGGIIGLERELKHKPVGVKTCAIIAVTTCVLTIVSIQAAEHYAQVLTPTGLCLSSRSKPIIPPSTSASSIFPRISK